MNTLERFEQFVNEITSTNGRIEKENILKSWSDDQGIKDIIYFVFNPYIVTGMSKKKFNKKVPTTTYCSANSIEEVMDYLKVHNTGSDKDIEWIQNFVAANHEYTYLIYQIVCKDLTIGLQPKTLNKIFGKGFIPTFEVQLAEKYFDNPEKYLPEGTRYMISEKLDGVRDAIVFENGYPHFFSRTGREFEGLVDITEEALKLDPNYVYDGEFLANVEGDSKDVYRQTVSITGADGEKKGIIFNAFDMVPKEDFMNGYSPIPASERKAKLKTIIDNNNFKWIKNVETLYEGTDQNKITEWLNWAHKNNKEGIMINLADKGYECKRTRNLLKVKTFNECEAYVIDLEEGTGRNEGRLGKIVVQVKDKEGKLHIVRSGSGFEDWERDEYWKHPEKIMNKVVELQYFEITNNKDDDSISLRFPVWMGIIRSDKSFEEMNTL